MSEFWVKVPSLEKPSFIQIEFGSEYNENDIDEYTFRNALLEEISETLNAHELRDCFSWDDYISIYQ